MEGNCKRTGTSEDDRMFLIALSRAFNKVSLSMEEGAYVSEANNDREGT